MRVMNEKTTSVRKKFEGRLLSVEEVVVRLDGGRTSTREIVRHPGAALVMARTADQRFLFVRQYRKPVEMVMLEVVAGTLEAGESPALCARRELREETGYEAETLRHLGRIYPAPGYSDEMIEVFLADLKENRGVAEPDHDEQLETVSMSRADIERLIASGEIQDAKTLAAWQIYLSREEAE